MIPRNPHIARMHAHYLFAEVEMRKQKFLKENPKAPLINLGIGDTTCPIPSHITKAFEAQAQALGAPRGYHGYGPSAGWSELREKIAHVLYSDMVSANEIFVSDGSKCDIGRLQLLFSPSSTIALQDPAYPAYVSSSVIAGRTGDYDLSTQQYRKIVYMPCKPENGFFPDLKKTPRTDLIFFCSPNNPTGTAPTRDQLQELVVFAAKNRSIIIFDASYAEFISDPSIPKSIFEISGAREVAIETNSFSKTVGFTGIRLGWLVIPHELRFADGTKVQDDWLKVISTFYNGTCHLAQAGGVAALDPEGRRQTRSIVDYYMRNTRELKKAMQKAGFAVYGAQHAPYLWIKLAINDSWKAFERFLHQMNLITTPGAGFGPSGEGYLRLSAFGQWDEVQEAARRLTSSVL